MKHTSKRLLALLLSVLMIMTLLPVGALAVTGNVAKIGETEYATLQAAFDAAKPGDTIKLLVDRLTVKDYVGAPDASNTVQGEGAWQNLSVPYGYYTEVTSDGTHAAGTKMADDDLANVVLRKSKTANSSQYNLQINTINQPGAEKGITIEGYSKNSYTQLGSLDFSGSDYITVRYLKFDAADAVKAIQRYEGDGVLNKDGHKTKAIQEKTYVCSVVDANYRGRGAGAPDSNNSAAIGVTIDSCKFYGTFGGDNNYFSIHANSGGGNAGTSAYNWTVKYCEFTPTKAYYHINLQYHKDASSTTTIDHNTFACGFTSAGFQVGTTYGNVVITNNTFVCSGNSAAMKLGSGGYGSSYTTNYTIKGNTIAYANGATPEGSVSIKNCSSVMTLNGVSMFPDDVPVNAGSDNHDLNPAVITALAENNVGVGNSEKLLIGSTNNEHAFSTTQTDETDLYVLKQESTAVKVAEGSGAEEADIQAIERNTEVSGVAAALTDNAVRAFMDDNRVDEKLNTGEDNIVEAKLVVNVELEKMEKTANESSVEFKLTPSADIYVNGDLVLPNQEVNNEDLKKDCKISVTIYTGFRPVQITHLADNGDVIEVFKGDQFVYDEATKTCTVTISHFSKLLAVEKVYVAQIGDTKYETLADAVKAAKAAGTAGQTITVFGETAGANLNGIPENLTIQGTTGNKITTDFGTDGSGVSLKGLKLTGLNIVGAKITFSNNVSDYTGLTIENCTMDGTGSGTPNPSAITLGVGTAPYDGIVIKNNTIANYAAYPASGILVNNSTGNTNTGTITIEGNKVSNVNYNGLQFVLATADLVIKDNEFTRTDSVDILNLASAKSVTVTGNTFTVPADFSTDNLAVKNTNCGKIIEVTDNTFVKGDTTLTEFADIATLIAGRTDNTTFVGYALTKDGNGKLTGGYLNIKGTPSSLPTDLVADDYKIVLDGTYGSVNAYKIVSKVYVAQIGTVKYETLDEALAAAKKDDEILLLTDIVLYPKWDGTGSVTFTNVRDSRVISKGITINGDGHSITWGGDHYCDNNIYCGMFAYSSKDTVTFKNLTIDCNNAIIWTNGNKSVYSHKLGAISSTGDASNLVIENCVFKNTFTAVEAKYDLTVKNSEFINCARAAIKDDNGLATGSTWVIDNNVFTNCKQDVGEYYANAPQTTFTNNTVNGGTVSVRQTSATAFTGNVFHAVDGMDNSISVFGNGTYAVTNSFDKTSGNAYYDICAYTTGLKLDLSKSTFDDILEYWFYSADDTASTFVLPYGYGVEKTDQAKWYKAVELSTIIDPVVVVGEDIKIGDKEIEVEGAGEEGQPTVEQAAEAINDMLDNKAVTTFEETGIDEATKKSTKVDGFNISMVLAALNAEAQKAGYNVESKVSGNGEITVTGQTAQTVVDLDVDKKINVELAAAKVEIKTEAGAVTTVSGATFDVKPTATITVTDSTGAVTTITAVIPNEAITAPIKFRIPVSANIGETTTAVWHSTDPSNFKRDFLGVFPILTDGNGENYIELSASEFSYYTYENIKSINTDDTVAIKTGAETFEGYKTLAAALAAVQNGQTVILMANNSETVTIGRAVSFTLDTNDYKFTGEIKSAEGFYVEKTPVSGGFDVKVAKNECVAETVVIPQNGTFKLELNGFDMGSVTLVKSGNGWKLTLNGKLISGPCGDVWQYADGHFYQTRTEKISRGFFLWNILFGRKDVTVTYYLSVDSSKNLVTNNTGAQFAAATLIKSTNYAKHVYDGCVSNGNGTHSKACIHCGKVDPNAKPVACEYVNGTCKNCGAQDPKTTGYINVNVNVHKTGLLFFKLYIADIKVSSDIVHIKKVEYSVGTSGLKYTTGNKVMSTKPINDLIIVVTASDGAHGFRYNTATGVVTPYDLM